MGMYTEILVKADVNVNNLSDMEKSVLNYLFNDGDRPDSLPDHPFFTLDRKLAEWPVFIIIRKR